MHLLRKIPSVTVVYWWREYSNEIVQRCFSFASISTRLSAIENWPIDGSSSYPRTWIFTCSAKIFGAMLLTERNLDQFETTEFDHRVSDFGLNSHVAVEYLVTESLKRRDRVTGASEIAKKICKPMIDLHEKNVKHNETFLCESLRSFSLLKCFVSFWSFSKDIRRTMNWSTRTTTKMKKNWRKLKNSRENIISVLKSRTPNS